MRVLSPAKINLHLRVGPKQTDGFHPLVSWMVTVGLFDILDFTLDTAGRVDLSCSDPMLAVDDRNLIVRAARILQAEMTKTSGGETSRKPIPPGQRGVRIVLRKIIPMGGGLGGGSSDAATTLIALNDLWSLGLSHQRLSEIAAGLGSDVPFFLNGPSGICTGRGEIVEKIDPPRVRWVVLLLPEISMPTPIVYRQFDQMPMIRGWNDAVDWAQWRNLLAEDLLRKLQNDLEPPAFSISPILLQLKESAEMLVARPVRMSGSGSTLFTLYDISECAKRAADEIQRKLAIRAICVPLATTEEGSG